MKNTFSSAVLLIVIITISFCSQGLIASETGPSVPSLAVGTDVEKTAADLNTVWDIQKYSRSIHIMAMLLVGFGFLMVFVKKYGRSAVTATYLLVSVAIPLYFLVKGMGIFGKPVAIEIDKLIMAQFAAASLLICAGAMLGRLKMIQYMVLGVIFVLCYMLNEWIVLESGFGLISRGFADTGGSIVIHAFGALFGLGVILTMTTAKEFAEPIEADATSDRFSMLGSMVLWMFWPSFCAALVAPERIPFTVINVVLALCGATLATYFSSVALRKGKISIADIANASLAGGVAIGSTCDYANHTAAFVIGILSGVISTFGFAVIQSKLQGKLKCIDTCGVLNLHGLPGLMGGFAALLVIKNINQSIQLKGIGITIVIALAAGYVTGNILSIFGRKAEVYADADEFADAEA
jgi:ammonium transporter Rh